MAGLGTQSLKVAKTIKLFIGGEFPRTESGRSFPVYVHKTKNLYANISRASRKDLRNAVSAAKSAQGGWESKTAYNRSQILYRMAEMMEAKREEFVEILKSCLGDTTTQANKSVDKSIDALIYYSGFADKYQQLMGSVNPVSGPHHNFTSAEPVGVVGLIFDKKFDMGDLVAQISAVICSGNTCVVLMPELGSGITAAFAEVLATSDLPKGVVNLLTGYLRELYKFFGSHMEIQSLSYSGEDQEVSSELRELAIGNMKRYVMKNSGDKSLDKILNFVEYKTVWHPVGF